MNELINFVSDVLCEGNKKCNAIAYLSDSGEHCSDIRIEFQRDHFRQYSSLLRFVADHDNMVIIETVPVTRCTTIRIFN